MVVFEVSSQHSSSYETPLTRETVQNRKYFTTLTQTHSIRAIKDDVVLDLCLAVLAFKMNGSTA